MECSPIRLVVPLPVTQSLRRSGKRPFCRQNLCSGLSRKSPEQSRAEGLTAGDFGRGISYNVACDVLCDIKNIIVEKSRYMHQNVNTLGKLKDSGWVSKSVKDELRDNLILKLRDRENLFPGIYGYDKTVIPQVIHSILSRHDLILLGLRGQAKTRILRMLPRFLDEYIPVVEGSEINDDPLRPISKYARDR